MSSANAKRGKQNKFRSSQNKMKFSNNSKQSRFSYSVHNYKGIAKLGFNGDFNKWKEELKSFVETDLPLLRNMFNQEPLDVTSGTLPLRSDSLYWVPGESGIIGNLSDLDEETRSKWIEFKNVFVKYLRTEYCAEDDESDLPRGFSGEVINKNNYSVEFKINM